MKRILLFLLLAGFFAACTSDLAENPSVGPAVSDDPDYVITQAEAEADLLNLLNDEGFQGPATRSGGVRRIAERHTLGSPIETRAEGGDAEPYIHIFNFENEEGFAIMSGDERVPSLLALTFGGSLRPGDTVEIPGLAIFLEGLPAYFAEQIAAADEQTVTTRSDDGPPNYFVDWGWENEYCIPFHVDPLLVDWHQDDPYNEYTPLKNGQPTAVGCYPVAVGQLMSMYKHPASYNGYAFDWNFMINGYRTPQGDPDLMISRLHEQLGLPQNLDVEYEAELFLAGDGSSAPTANIKRTLNNFGYTCSSPTTYKKDVVINELRNGYPCLMLGGDSNEDAGHGWLVHGLNCLKRWVERYDKGIFVNLYYEEEGFHLLCDMGIKGNKGDGYYLGNVFNTTTASNPWEYRFDQGLGMITNIRKN